MEERSIPRSEMRLYERIGALLWIPVHVLGLPLLLLLLFPEISSSSLNFWTYAVGCSALTLLCLGFLRRDFDRLWEKPLRILGTAGLGFCVLLLVDALLSALFLFILPWNNPNDYALMELLLEDRQRIIVITAILAPILEELMFRGGVFGLLRRKSRAAAYVLCMLLFALYHTWQYALEDPIYWLYLIQYLPAGFLLCLAYERTECIWTPIFLHMLNNGISLMAMLKAGG